jgi:hypothetical protein
MRTFERLFLITGAALAGASLAAGCGGGDSDSDSEVTTGLAQSKLLSDVSESEAAQACERLQAGIDSRLTREVFVKAVCTLVSAASASTPAECESLRDDCIGQADQQGSEVAQAVDEQGVDLECSGDADLTACTGTVGQLETCFNDTLDQFDALLHAITCADAGTVAAEDVDGFGDDMEPPASCDAVDCGEGSPFGG